MLSSIILLSERSIRCFSTVRVRFAPSPTGDLHLGGLRTALYNYAFAKHENGTFILRIEDTDRTRLVPGSIEQIQNVLSTFKLIPDEGPNQGGPYGPYIQSQRTELYKELTKTLIDKGAVFPCFCSQHRLQWLKSHSNGSKSNGSYDNRCLYIDPEEAKDRIQKGEPYVLRLKPPKEDIHIYDEIKGDICFKPQQIDSQVLIKSDGLPTYHFANVVDDHYMKISHVIRGEEWLSSTPKHVMLYKAFGWEPPKFVHIPLLLNEQKQKLSKREGHSSVLHLLEEGYSCESILSFISTLGWSGIDNSIIDKKNAIYTLEDICKYFDISRLNSSSAIVDPKRLQNENHLYISNLPKTKEGMELFYSRVTPYITALDKQLQSHKDQYIHNNIQNIQNKAFIERLISLCSSRCHYMSDFDGFLRSIFLPPWELESKIYNTYSIPQSIIEKSSSLLSSLSSSSIPSFTAQNIGSVLSTLPSEYSLSNSQFLIALRVLITGNKKGFSLFDTLEMIGRDECIYRIQHFLENKNKN
ncbi:hypothetical protein WA158_001476 [Blastocystis sp. Blastoise]